MYVCMCVYVCISDVITKFENLPKSKILRLYLVYTTKPANINSVPS